MTCLACMISQDDSALPTFNPHGGPITHRSQDRNLTLMYNPISNGYPSRLASYLIHGPPSYCSIVVSDTILTLAALNPFLTLVQTSSNYLSAWNLLLYLRTLLSMYFIRSNLRDTLMLIHGLTPDCFPHKHSVVAELPLTYS